MDKFIFNYVLRSCSTLYKIDLVSDNPLEMGDLGPNPIWLFSDNALSWGGLCACHLPPSIQPAGIGAAPLESWIDWALEGCTTMFHTTHGDSSGNLYVANSCIQDMHSYTSLVHQFHPALLCTIDWIWRQGIRTISVGSILILVHLLSIVLIFSRIFEWKNCA